MAAFSDYLENKIIDNYLRGVDYTSTVVYVSLYESDPTDADSGTETSYTDYARQQVEDLASLTVFNAGSNGVTSNNAAITFPANGQAGAVTITHFALHDALTTGNMLFHAALTASKTLNQNDQLSFPIGALTITIQ